MTTAKNGIFYILAAALLWGTTGTAQALAPAGVNPVALGALRVIIGGGALLVLALSRQSFRGISHWPLLPTAVSAVFIAAYQLSFFAAVSLTGVAVGTMVAIGSSPVAAGLLGYLVRVNDWVGGGCSPPCLRLPAAHCWRQAEGGCRLI